jgi:hypothetical protein
VLLDVAQQGDEASDQPSASGYAKTVALIREAADKLAEPSVQEPARTTQNDGPRGERE